MSERSKARIVPCGETDSADVDPICATTAVKFAREGYQQEAEDMAIEIDHAFEAMREAMRRYHGPCERTDGGHCPMLPIDPLTWCRACQLSAALALANKES